MRASFYLDCGRMFQFALSSHADPGRARARGAEKLKGCFWGVFLTSSSLACIAASLPITHLERDLGPILLPVRSASGGCGMDNFISGRVREEIRTMTWISATCSLDSPPISTPAWRHHRCLHMSINTMHYWHTFLLAPEPAETALALE